MYPLPLSLLSCQFSADPAFLANLQETEQSHMENMSVDNLEDHIAHFDALSVFPSPASLEV